MDGGGRPIGIFERIAVTLSIIAAQVSLLAVVVAIKGLARYPDIKAGHLTAEKIHCGHLRLSALGGYLRPRGDELGLTEG